MFSHLYRFGVSALCGLALSSIAHARLGETTKECEARYGAPVESISSMIPGSDAEAVRYRRNQVEVTVHFKDSIAWHVAYSRPHLNDTDTKTLLNENSNDREWKPSLGEKIGTIRFWRCTLVDYVAAASEMPGLAMLEIMTKTCADEITTQREARIAEATTPR